MQTRIRITFSLWCGPGFDYWLYADPTFHSEAVPFRIFTLMRIWARHRKMTRIWIRNIGSYIPFLCVCEWLYSILFLLMIGSVNNPSTGTVPRLNLAVVTLLCFCQGVLTHGELDNGRGFARQKLFRHKHEAESGRWQLTTILQIRLIFIAVSNPAFHVNADLDPAHIIRS
jgi:hypothetical protein